MKPIVLLCGVKDSGKNTVANLLAAHVHAEQVALADPFKRLFVRLFNLNPQVLWGPSALRDQPAACLPVDPATAYVFAEEFFRREIFPRYTLNLDHCLRAFSAWYADVFQSVYPGGRPTQPTRLSAEQPRVTMVPRGPLQTFGTEVVREQVGADTWIDTCLHVADVLLQEGGGYTQEAGMLRRTSIAPPEYVFVTDGRFPNEIQGVLSADGAAFLVDRPDAAGGTGHASETSLGNVSRDSYTGVIANDADLETLGARARAAFDAAYPRAA